MGPPSIYQIIEFLHHVGVVLQTKSDCSSDENWVFLLKALNRDEISNFLRFDVINLNALDYTCYSAEKDCYIRFLPIGNLQLSIGKSNFRRDFIQFMLSILYKNRVSLRFSSSLTCINSLMQTMREINEKIAQYLVCDFAAEQNIGEDSSLLLAPRILIEEEILTSEDRKLIKSLQLLDKDIQVLKIGEKPNIENIPQGLKNLGFISSPVKYFSISGSRKIHLVDIRDHSFLHLYSCALDALRQMTTIACSDRLDDEFEHLEDPVRTAIIQAKTQRILSIARDNSPFYQRKFGAMPRSATQIDLKNYPFVIADELREYGFPAGDDLLTGPLKSCYVFNSGGSTGVPKISIRTFTDQNSVGNKHGKGMILNHFAPSDIIANLFSAGNLWAGFQTMNLALERIGCCILPLGSGMHPKDLVSTLLRNKATAIVGARTSILSLAKFVEHNHVKGLKVKKMFTGGEMISDHVKDYLVGVFGLEVFSAAGYSALDVGAIGFQCKYCPLDTYHINEDQVLIEVIDSQSLNPLPIGEKGELVATHLERELMPVIRYRYGDQGRILKNRCPCGRGTKLLQLIGRSDDTLIIGGVNIEILNIESIVHSVPGLSLNFQVIAEEIDSLDQLKLIVEASAEHFNEKVKSELETKLKEAFYNSMPFLKNMAEASGIKMPVLEVVPLNTLKRNSRTGKLKKSVELRGNSK